MVEKDPMSMESIRKMRCRILIKAVEYVYQGYSLHDAIEAAEIDADTEDLDKFYKAGGRL